MIMSKHTSGSRLPHLAALVGLAFALGLAGCNGGEESPRPDSPPEIGDEPTDRDMPPEQSAPEPEEGEEPELVEESASVAEQTQAEDQSLMLARADAVEPAGDWKYTEGRHFQRLVPAQPTVGGADKVEVAEIFWYGCSHCFDFEPHINRWVQDDMPADARFVRIPAMWNPLVKMHAQLYYAEQVLAKNGTLKDLDGFHTAVFNEYHRRGNRLASVDAIRALFERFGVSEEDFQQAWSSFEVDQRMRVAEDLARRYGVTGVPTVVVNGKYRTGASEAGGYPELLDVIEELVAREAAR